MPKHHAASPSPESADVPEAAVYRMQRMGADLYTRALDGPVFYLLGYLLICITGGYGHLGLVWLPAVLFVLLWLLRRRNRLPADTARFQGWRRRQWLLIHAGCVLWAVVFVRVCQLEQGNTIPLLIAVICTVAYGTAASNTFSLDPRHALLTISLLFLPAVALLLSTNVLRPIGITLAIYNIYLALNLRRAAREYDAHIHAEYALLQSRAEIEKLTRQDSLTGLANRREYESRFWQVWGLAARQQADLSLIVLDIDHFKRVNDDYGHQVGDACLQHFAAQMRQCFRRAGDHLVRYGGEEFVVLLQDCNAGLALQLAEDFQQHLRATPYRHDVLSIAMTASMGVGAVRWVEDESPASVFARVDRACYEAKRLGRDRIVLASGALAVGEPSIAVADEPLPE